MLQKYEIFINDAILRITNPDNIPEVLRNRCFLFPDAMDECIYTLTNKVNSGYFYLYAEMPPKELFESFMSKFSQIEAAGGIVRHKRNDGILMIYRNGKWDLPKGKIDAGENAEEAAVREVSEECGIPNPEITATLCRTRHMYHFNSELVIKTTHWYEMIYDGNSLPVPQAEENISKAEWVAIEDVEMKLKNTYPNIKSLIQDYLYRFT